MGGFAGQVTASKSLAPGIAGRGAGLLCPWLRHRSRRCLRLLLGLLSLLLLHLLLLPLLFQLRHADEILPADDHEHRARSRAACSFGR